MARSFLGQVSHFWFVNAPRSHGAFTFGVIFHIRVRTEKVLPLCWSCSVTVIIGDSDSINQGSIPRGTLIFLGVPVDAERTPTLKYFYTRVGTIVAFSGKCRVEPKICSTSES